jgi:hypothetical protein
MERVLMWLIGNEARYSKGMHFEQLISIAVIALTKMFVKFTIYHGMHSLRAVYSVFVWNASHVRVKINRG